jgi:uncharacterized phage protein (TIGR01671 family)
MREIKFRAWDKDCKKMITNFLLPKSKSFGMYRMAISFTGEVFAFTDWDMAEYGEDEMYNSAKYPSRFKIMQYTGLKDKNGKEIYEGDIIRRRWLKGEEVRYVEEVIIFDIGAFWCNLKGGCCGELLGSHLTRVIPSQIEVIGNIYENPELLEAHHG